MPANTRVKSPNISAHCFIIGVAGMLAGAFTERKLKMQRGQEPF